MTIKIQFTEAEIKQLDYERYHHPHPRVQRKMEALWLKSQGASHQDIYKYAGISANTLCQYLRDYQSGGIEQLKQLNFYHPNCDLCQFQSTLAEYFRQTPPATVNEARAKILELTGINRSPTRVRHFLKALGLSYRKVGMIPAKADVAVQEDFQKKHLEPRLTEAKAGSRAVFFVDAAHFVLAPFLGWLWCVKRLFLKAPSGRQRLNVLAALKVFSHELVMVTNHDYVNAQTVCELLHKLSQLSLDVPLTLVMDNARYQKCRAVQELALQLNIELLFLPPYSPNLNLIERLWRWVKKKCLYSKYYDNFEGFTQAILSCLSQTHTTYKTETDSLLTLKFQRF
jgi:transposase